MNQPDADFRFIPVEMAAQIGRDCRKDQVIVLYFDQSCGMLATATWWNTPEDKIAAAMAGESLADLIGADLSRALCNADFRHVPAAEAAARIDELLQRLQQARELVEFVRDWFRSPANLVSPKWGAKFPCLMATWMERSAEWLAREPQPGPPTTSL